MNHLCGVEHGDQAAGWVRYFAYGSNLHPLRLGERVPSARVVAIGALAGHRLAFHKRGRDGSGKCDCVPSGAVHERVLGAIFEFRAGERPALDRCEGDGYARRIVEIQVGEARLEAYLYQAMASHTTAGLPPFDWYKALVIAGARHHRLEPDYVAALEGVRASHDPDPARAATHQALLDRIARHIG